MKHDINTRLKIKKINRLQEYIKTRYANKIWKQDNETWYQKFDKNKRLKSEAADLEGKVRTMKQPMAELGILSDETKMKQDWKKVKLYQILQQP